MELGTSISLAFSEEYFGQKMYRIANADTPMRDACLCTAIGAHINWHTLLRGTFHEKEFIIPYGNGTISITVKNAVAFLKWKFQKSDGVVHGSTMVGLETNASEFGHAMSVICKLAE